MDTILQEFGRRCAASGSAAHPKYRRLMIAIQETVSAGTMRPGDRLPTEKDIADALPFALGTVQKALNGLVAQGLLRRNRRSGTFVADDMRPLDDLSRFTFEHTDGKKVASVMTRVVDILQIPDGGRPAAVLGDCGDGFVEIRRRDAIDDDFVCHVRIHLRRDAYGPLLHMTPDALAGQNIRSIVETRFGVAIENVTIGVGIALPPPGVSSTLRPAGKDQVLQVEMTGFDATGSPVFLQTVFVPEAGYRISFGQAAN